MQPGVKVAGGVTPIPKQAHNHRDAPRFHLRTPPPQPAPTCAFSEQVSARPDNPNNPRLLPGRGTATVARCPPEQL